MLVPRVERRDDGVFVGADDALDERDLLARGLDALEGAVPEKVAAASSSSDTSKASSSVFFSTCEAERDGAFVVVLDGRLAVDLFEELSVYALRKAHDVLCFLSRLRCS